MTRRILAACAIAALAAACGDASSGPEGPDASTFADANTTVGCNDTASDPFNCGACGRSCVIPNAQAGCAEGECVIAACAPGYSDDDGELVNGCESEGGSCRAEACNLADDDCDGQCDEGGLAGCRLGVHRSNGNGHMYSSDLAASQTAPYRVEAQDYFRTYTTAAPGLSEAYLCRKGDGKHFLTTSAACEGAGTVVQSIGFWSADARCGAVPLYRLYHSGSGNHFYTVSAAERDNAANNLGYRLERIAGYVWTAP